MISKPSSVFVSSREPKEPLDAWRDEVAGRGRISMRGRRRKQCYPRSRLREAQGLANMHGMSSIPPDYLSHMQSKTLPLSSQRLSPTFGRQSTSRRTTAGELEQRIHVVAPKLYTKHDRPPAEPSAWRAGVPDRRCVE